MKVLVDARTIKDKPSGVGLWNLRLLENLIRQKGVIVYALLGENCTYDFSHRGAFREYLGKNFQLIHTNHAYNFVDWKRFVFEQTALTKIIHTIHPDLYHATDSFGIPFRLSKKIKTILTVHDLIPLTVYRERLAYSQRFLYRLSLAISLKKATHVVAISDKTKQDLRTFGKLKGRKIEIIYNGVDPAHQLSSMKRQSTWEGIAKKYNLGQYILYYGGFGKRRNVETIISVFKQLVAEKVIAPDVSLVLAGRISQAYPEARESIAKLQAQVKQQGLGDRVVFMDFLSEDEKIVLTDRALLFVFLSLYEGFGLPPIEVLARGKAAVFSRTGIWHSFSHQSNYLVENPLSVEEVFLKVVSALKSDSNHAHTRLSPILNFIQGFSWEKMAKEYLNLYKSGVV